MRQVLSSELLSYSFIYHNLHYDSAFKNDRMNITSCFTFTIQIYDSVLFKPILAEDRNMHFKNSISDVVQNFA